MAETDKITWQTSFVPKLQTIPILTVLQCSVTIIPTALILCFSLLLLSSHSNNKYLISALILSVTGLLLNIFSVYIFVSRWVTSIMDPRKQFIRNVSFHILYSIVKPRIAVMFATGFTCSIISFVCFSLAAIRIIEMEWNWILCIPLFASIWIVIEGINDICRL
jgi:hypothetical protein